MGRKPVDRVKTLLGKLDSMRRSKEQGYSVSEEIRHPSNKFVGRVEQIFKNLPKPLEWRSFFNHDLPLLIDFCEEVQEISIQQRLNSSQTRALQKFKLASEQEFQRVTAHAQKYPNTEMGHVSRISAKHGEPDAEAESISRIIKFDSLVITKSSPSYPKLRGIAYLKLK